MRESCARERSPDSAEIATTPSNDRSRHVVVDAVSRAKLSREGILTGTKTFGSSRAQRVQGGAARSPCAATAHPTSRASLTEEPTSSMPHTTSALSKRGIATRSTWVLHTFALRHEATTASNAWRRNSSNGATARKARTPLVRARAKGPRSPIAHRRRKQISHCAHNIHN